MIPNHYEENFVYSQFFFGKYDRTQNIIKAIFVGLGRGAGGSGNSGVLIAKPIFNDSYENKGIDTQVTFK